jgi:hypothetical protein
MTQLRLAIAWALVSISEALAEIAKIITPKDQRDNGDAEL